MRFLYLLFYLFTVSFCATAQSDTKKNIARHSLNEMREKLNVLTKKDSVTYYNWLHAYIKKGKASQNSEHLFNAYKHFVFTTDDPKVMHLFTDSLNQQALKINEPLHLIDTYQIRSTVFYIEKNYQQSLAYELKALQLIDQKKHAYEYHKSLYAIGQTYFYLQQYEDALAYFEKARKFFEGSSSYKYQLGFMNSIRYEALTHTYLKNYSYSNELVDKGFSQLPKITPDEQNFEKAYINYVYALNLYFLNDYQKSIATFKSALPEIITNEDYANESIAYYYIGVNYWKLGKKEDAIAYFNKVDAFFQEKNYANLETKEAYTYLMDYYKQQKNEEKQLYYTNQLLKVTVFLQNEYRFLSTALHKQLDIKHLESEKARLEYSLQTKSRLFTAAIVGGSLLLIGFAVALLWNYLKKKEYSKRYNELVAQRKNAKAEEKTQLTEIAKPTPVVADVPTNVPEPSTVVDVNTQEDVRVTEVPASIEALTATPEISQPAEKEINSNSKKNERSTVTGASNKVWENITQYLEVFEENQGFLDPNINLNQLAVLFETNRSYLSSYINASKEKTFNDYVNQLRIDYLLAQFESNPQWIHYKISHIAELLGFPSSRSFSNAFIKCTGISPSFYIGQLKEEAQT